MMQNSINDHTPKHRSPGQEATQHTTGMGDLDAPFIQEITEDHTILNGDARTAVLAEGSMPLSFNQLELLKALSQRLGLEDVQHLYEAQKEVTSHAFYGSHGLENLGSLCFLSQLIRNDFLVAEKLLSELSAAETAELRDSVEAVLKNTFTQPNSPWGILLKKFAEGTATSVERSLIRGYLDPYIDLKSEPNRNFLKRLGDLITRRRVRPDELENRLKNPNLEGAEIKFIRSLVTYFDVAEQIEAKKRSDELEVHKIATERDRAAVEVIHANTNAEVTKARAQQAVEVAKQHTIQAAAAVLADARELQRLRRGELPTDSIRLEDIPSLVQVVAASEGCPGIISAQVDYSDSIRAVVANPVKVTYTNLRKLEKRDHSWRTSDSAGYSAAQDNWRKAFKDVLTKGLILEIPAELAHQINGLQDSSHFLRKNLKNVRGKWELHLGPLDTVDQKFTGDFAWTNIRINDGGIITFHESAGYNLNMAHYPSLAEQVLENIVLNLLVQAIETYHNVARVP